MLPGTAKVLGILEQLLEAVYMPTLGAFTLGFALHITPFNTIIVDTDIFQAAVFFVIQKLLQLPCSRSRRAAITVGRPIKVRH